MTALRRWLVLSVMVVLLASGPAGAVDVESQLRQMIRAHDLRNTRVAAMVMDLDRDVVLAQINASEPMIPASNMKLVTTAAALDILGPDFVFRTTLGVIEPDDDDTPPDLLVVGDGDPAFGDPILLSEHGFSVDQVLEQWVAAVTGAGIRRVGQLIVDDRTFDRQFVHPTWPEGQLIHGYCAQVAGVNFHLNCLNVMLVPAERMGVAPRLELFPEAPIVQTINEVSTGRSDSYWVARKPGTNVFTFRGTVRNRPWEPVQVTVHDPPMWFAHVLAQRLRDAGVTVDAVTRPADEAILPPARALHMVQTTLPLVLTRTNRDSQNMFAEALLKRMGRAVTGAPGSWENGAAAVRLSLRSRLGPSSAAVTIADGSGMSRDNRVTAQLLVQLLASLHDDAHPDKARLFRESLAHAGHSGTLESRLADLAGEVYGKSGYLREVSALSGYLIMNDADGSPRTIAFSFLFNGFQPPLHNHHMKDLQNRMVTAIENAVRTSAKPVGLGG